MSFSTTNQKKFLDAAGLTYFSSKLNNYPTNDVIEAVIEGVQDALDEKVDISAIGSQNGVASLDATGKVPASQLPDTTYSNASLGQGHGTCATAEATAAKVVSLSSYALVTGGIVAVKFTCAVPASATMNINSKGAKPIYYHGSAISAGIIKAGDLAVFMYNGSQYHLIAIDRNITEAVDPDVITDAQIDALFA